MNNIFNDKGTSTSGQDSSLAELLFVLADILSRTTPAVDGEGGKNA